MSDYEKTKSLEVLSECAQSNGAIVAAPTHNSNYPEHAVDYGYCWPRDAAYQLYATWLTDKTLGAQRRDAYAKWLMEDCEEFSETGLLYKRYKTTGERDLSYGAAADYQPDQAGALLWLFGKTTEDGSNELVSSSIKLLANGISSVWDIERNTFNKDSENLWENSTLPGEKQEDFTYSVAICAVGLKKAIEHNARHDTYRFEEAEVSEWQVCLDSMLNLIKGDARQDFFMRTLSPSETNYTQPLFDASDLALAFPFAGEFSGLFEDEGLRNKLNHTIEAIDEALNSPEGVYRYLGDSYDGIVDELGSVEGGAGGWPLLTFWLSLAKIEYGVLFDEPESVAAGRQCADEYMEYTSSLYEDGAIKNGLLPEQIFANDSTEKQGKGVVPLGWSHAMYIILQDRLEKPS